MSRSDPLKNEAEVLARSIDLGVTRTTDVSVWVDAVLEREERAPPWLCDLATMGTGAEQDVVHVLRDVPGLADETWVRDELVRQLARGLAEDRRRADAIALALNTLVARNHLPERELAALAWWAWDGLVSADAGEILQTREQVIDQMLAALTAAAAKTRP